MTNTNGNTNGIMNLYERGYAFEWCKEWSGCKMVKRAKWCFNGECGEWGELTAHSQVALSSMSDKACEQYKRYYTEYYPDIDRWVNAVCIDSAIRSLVTSATRLGYKEGESVEEWTERAEALANASTSTCQAVARYLRECGELISIRGQLVRGDINTSDIPSYCGGDAYEWYSRGAEALCLIIKRVRAELYRIWERRGNKCDIHPSALICVLRPKSGAKERKEYRVTHITTDEEEANRLAVEKYGEDGEVARLSRLIRGACAREDKDKAYLSMTAISEEAKAKASYRENTIDNIEITIDETKRKAIRKAVADLLRSYTDEEERKAVAVFITAVASVDLVAFKGVYKPNITEASKRAFPALSEEARRSKARRILDKFRKEVEKVLKW